MRACRQPVISAVEGICAGAGAIIAMSSDLRYASPTAKVSFLFNRVGLAGCDMGACAILPRIIGQGRASDLLYFGRSLGAEQGEQWGFFNAVTDDPLAHAKDMAKRIASGPTFANGMTKMQLHQEWTMSVDQAIEVEAQAQAICMQTEDFKRAYNAFIEKEQPIFQGD
jgi:enoyl-CoA hydratase/carnithine racemase